MKVQELQQKDNKKRRLSAESTYMPSAHLAVQVADHEFRPAIIGHVFAGIGVDGFRIPGKEAVEIAVQLYHIHAMLLYVLMITFLEPTFPGNASWRK